MYLTSKKKFFYDLSLSTRAIKLLGERIKTVHTHERLLETIVTTEELRRLRENYRRKNTNKDLIQKVTDSMLRSSGKLTILGSKDIFF